MKCQSLFSRKNKKNIISLSSAEFFQRIAKFEVSVFYSSQLLILYVCTVLLYQFCFLCSRFFPIMVVGLMETQYLALASKKYFD